MLFNRVENFDYPGLNRNTRGECRLSIFQNGAGAYLVLTEDFGHNPGPSVTNATRFVREAIQLYLPMVISENINFEKIIWLQWNESDQLICVARLAEPEGEKSHPWEFVPQDLLSQLCVLFDMPELRQPEPNTRTQ